MDKKVELHDIFTTNYVEYAKYTITDRAIPALEDGCKNIHRRILWSMHVNKNTYDKNRVKANTSVGLCMGYSPHGNTSIYGAMVRFANDSVNLNLIDGKGAFSSKTSRDIDAGADRYVEVRLAPITQEYLKDIDKNIAGMKNNYDDTKLEPIYLPVTFPSILCNPNLGIATGIASNICAFPVEDVIDNTIRTINNEDIEIMIPTFSTGGELIYNENILRQIQDTGTGKLIIRSKYEIKNNSLIITQIPYTTTREAIVEKIIDMVKEGKLKSVVDVNDHTGKGGLKITIDAKKNTNMEQLIQFLFKKTPLQDTFSCNFNVLDNGSPKTLGTKDIIIKWIEFRRKCVINGINYDIINKSEKLHLLLGLESVLLDIDKAVEIIRHSNNPLDNLVTTFNIDKIQAENVLNMRLKNINKDYIIKQIKDINLLRDDVESLKINVNNMEYINNIIKEDLLRVKKIYSYPRQTEILHDVKDSISNDIEVEDYLCTLIYTKENYFKKTRKYSLQQNIKDGDDVQTIVQCSNKDKAIFISNQGNAYFLNLWEQDEQLPSKMGQYLQNLLPLEKEETIIGMLSTNSYKGEVIIVYPDSHLAIIPLESYKTKQNSTRVKNCLAKKLGLPILITQITNDVDIEFTDCFNNIKIINTKDINRKDGKDAQGITAWGSKKKGFSVVSAKLLTNKQ